ncbi:MAG: acyl carrier protein [Hungatella sp.]|nr:acyl carrier protein [Hungatella sp.]
MTKGEVLAKLNEIAQEVFEDDELILKENTVASDVDGWDSLTHLQLISDIEDEFKIKFLMGEIQGFANVGELVNTIINHVEGN